MKSVLKVAAFAALIAVTGANAQAQEAAADGTATASQAGRGDKGDGAAGTAGSSATGTAPAILNKNTTEPVNTSSAALPAKIEASPRRIFGELYTETYIAMPDFEKGTGGAVLNSFAGVKYDLGDTNSIAIRQNFDYVSATGGKNADLNVQDLVVNFTRGKLAEFNNGVTLTFIARGYAPTGETSNANGTQGQGRLYLITSKSLGKFDLSHVLMGRGWLQTRNYNQGTNAETGAATYSQFNQAHLLNELDAFYNITPKIAIGMIVGLDNFVRTPAPGKSTRYDDLYFQPTIQIAPVKGLTLQALLYDELNLTSPTQQQRLFRGNETQISFNAAAAL